jgi:hypothetical protein
VTVPGKNLRLEKPPRKADTTKRDDLAEAAQQLAFAYIADAETSDAARLLLALTLALNNEPDSKALATLSRAATKLLRQAPLDRLGGLARTAGANQVTSGRGITALIGICVNEGEPRRARAFARRIVSEATVVGWCPTDGAESRVTEVLAATEKRSDLSEATVRVLRALGLPSKRARNIVDAALDMSVKRRALRGEAMSSDG